MISVLISKIMKECTLKQKDLAEILEVPLQRVKRLTGGEVQKLTPDETRRLVQTLNLSAHWLATGEGPMFNTQGGQKLGEMLTQLRLMTVRLTEMEIDGPVASAVVSIVLGVANNDAHSVKDGLIQAAHDMQTPDERALLDAYQRCTPQARANLIETAALLSAGMAAPDNSPKRSTRASPPGGVHQAINAPVSGGVAGGNITNNSHNNKK